MRGALGRVLRLAACLAAFALGACASSYQERSFLSEGGYSEVALAPDIYRVRFVGSEFTNGETVQAFWLYRCAELTLQKGYDGFEILGDPKLIGALRPGARGPHAMVQKAWLIIVPVPVGRSGPQPDFSAEIRLLKRPFTPAPPRVFDAAALKTVLEPHVNGPKCKLGNVCPHPHDYLKPALAGPSGSS